VTVVCLPDEGAVDLLRGGLVPEGVEIAVWDGTGEPAGGARRTTFLVPPVDDVSVLPAYFDAMPDLQVVQLTTAGVEEYIPLIPYGVTLCTARGVHGPSVAELVVLFVLATRRRLPHFLDAQRDGRWDLVEGEDLEGLHVLFLGAGDLARQSAHRLAPFEVRTTFVGSRARDGVRALSELPTLLPDADVVVVTLPLTDDTRRLVDAGFLARLHDGALLVNVARGEIVDTAALLAELHAGRLAAALDVTDPEPLPDGHPLFAAPNTIITPHAAGHIAQAGPRAFALVREQLARFVDGDELHNVITGDY
jgi:phosphoglycerate dehydrogenase-like enzyme